MFYQVQYYDKHTAMWISLKYATLKQEEALDLLHRHRQIDANVNYRATQMRGIR